MVVHWYTVTQLCSPVPTVSKQSQFNSWWYTGTLSHNSVLLKTLPQDKFNLYCGGTLVHCHTTVCFLVPTVSNQSQFYSCMVVHWYTVTQLCSPVPTVSKQSQFNLWWYTGTLSHNFVPQCLLSPTKVNLIHGGTLVHCHTTLLPSAYCLQTKSI
jgi:hypothetical protein